MQAAPMFGIGWMELLILLGFVGLVAGVMLFGIFYFVLNRKRMEQGTSVPRSAVPPSGAKDLRATIADVKATMPLPGEPELAVGDTGWAITPLRPTGQARFGERICNVLVQGDFVEQGGQIRIVAKPTGNLVVESIRHLG